MVRDILFPPRCPFCERIVKNLGGICETCKTKLPYIKEPRCKKCSKPIENGEEEYCFDCKNRDFSYTGGRAVWKYEKEVKLSISRFKFKDKQEYAKAYGDEIIRLYGDWMIGKGIEAFIPVPLNEKKKRMRGYNQAELIAKVVGSELNIPVVSGVLIRTIETRPQKELNDKDRISNLSGAFAAKGEFLRGIKRIALFDDIYTTGSTIEACAKVLKRIYIEEVYFICVSIGVGI